MRSRSVATECERASGTRAGYAMRSGAGIPGPLGRYPQAALERMPPWVRTRYSRPLHADRRTRTGVGLAIEFGDEAQAFGPHSVHHAAPAPPPEGEGPCTTC